VSVLDKNVITHVQLLKHLYHVFPVKYAYVPFFFVFLFLYSSQGK